MKMTKLTLMAAAVGLALFAGSAQANSITGEIAFGGTAHLDTQALGSATKVVSYVGPVDVGYSSSGDYGATDGFSGVTFKVFSWNPSSAPIADLWKFVDAGVTYSFDLSSLTVVSQDNSFLNITGTGTLDITGFDPTPGAWSFTIDQSLGSKSLTYNFGFAAQNSAAIPDGGLTIALLGGALIGLRGLRRLFGN